MLSCGILKWLGQTWNQATARFVWAASRQPSRKYWLYLYCLWYLWVHGANNPNFFLSWEQDTAEIWAVGCLARLRSWGTNASPWLCLWTLDVLTILYNFPFHLGFIPQSCLLKTDACVFLLYGLFPWNVPVSSPLAWYHKPLNFLVFSPPCCTLSHTISIMQQVNQNGTYPLSGLNCHNM